MKTNTVTLSAAFLAIAGEQALLSGREALASDGHIIAALPLPEGFAASRVITPAGHDITIGPDDGEATEESFDMAGLRHASASPAYRMAIHPGKLAALAAALASVDILILELPTSPENPIHVLPANGLPGDGFIMPLPIEGMPEGLLINQKSKIINPQSETPAELPPPIINAVPDRHTIEIHFGGKPAREILDSLKDPSLGFRYSGRGTRRGVPANTWYGPDNPYTRQKITELLAAPITQAAA